MAPLDERSDDLEGPAVVDVHRYHEISEANHTTLNPLAAEQVTLIGGICGLHPGQRQLDLASGKGEMLCQYARRYGITGVGVDVHPPCIEAANARAVELGVERSVDFVLGDAAAYEPPDGQPPDGQRPEGQPPEGQPPEGPPDCSFDIVSCIGATWIGGGVPGTLELMRRRVRHNGWLLVGDIYWIETPPPAILQAVDYECLDLAGMLACFDAARVDLVEMVLSNHDTWDRYRASQWLNVAKWLDAHPDDAEADAIRRWRDDARRQYMEYERRYLGWGVFILRPM